MAGGSRVGRVLLDSPLPQLDHLFDYLIPPELAQSAVPGVRVRVPLRTQGRSADGYLIELAHDEEFTGKLRSIESVTSTAKVLSPEVWELARQVADRAAGSAIDVIRLAVPGRQVRVEKAWLASERHEGWGTPENSGRPDDSRTPEDSGTPEMVDAAAPVEGLSRARSDYAPGALDDALRDQQRIALDAVPRLVRLSNDRWVGHWALLLAELAARTWVSGRSGIVALPDYRDQAQVESALDSIGFGAAVARLDARQSNPERYRAFLSCLDGPRIVVGNRSAIYAPAAQLGLIAIWDDGDPLHAEPLSPYVHARDAALIRQQQQGGMLVFAGHTRSIEVQRLVEIGYLEHVTPSRSAGPRVIATDQQPADNAALQRARIPSSAWQAARTALESGPVLVQVGRPGYAPVLACSTCGHPARCAVCDGPLGITSATATPACNWCGALATNWSCANCAHTGFRMITIGSGRTAEDLGRAFPGARVLVSDGETPKLEVASEPALVVATRGAEPLAPNGYSAVLLLDGERMLNRESLTVADDCLRWWSNAAALARPGAPVVLVGVGGRLARALATWRQTDYARAELIERRTLTLPPAVRIVSVTGVPSEVEASVRSILESERIDILGPTPAGEGLVRAIVRFEYSDGSAVASALRAAVIKNATTRRGPTVRTGQARRAPTLKVHFDDLEIL